MIIKINRKIQLLILFLFFSLFIVIICLSSEKFIKSKDTNSDMPVNEAITFIVDPGHGGEDGGTSSKSGILEKDINLSISLNLKELLNLAGFNVIMTRDKDQLIYDEHLQTMRQKKVSDIRNRMKLIEESPNPILISVHQNHFENSEYCGTQVFFSKNNPQSKLLANSIQYTVKEMLQNQNDRGIKSTGSEIYLLYHARIPAVMVECGFLSNESETALLKNEKYQSKMAFSVLCGILRYLESNIPLQMEVK